MEEKEFIMSKKSVATIYNPNQLSKNELISNYVVRLRKFEKIFKDIKSSKMDRPEQHLLIEGQRGMGKTTLLLRLSYEIENDHELSQWLIPIAFNEEQYNVSSLSGLWELIAQYLGDNSDAFEGLFDEMDSNYTRFEENERAYEKFIFELLIRALRREDKKLLLFIDNFGEMFSKLEGESQRLREILMTCEHIRIIAASSLVSEAFFKYDEPLYEFFKIEKLNELTLEETKLLLLKLGETYGENRVKEIVENEPERLETLRRLTGGVTRTMVLLYEIFVDDETGNAFKDLESVLDRVTPLYKHRMDDLSPQHQKIVHSIAMNWDAMPTKDISKKTRIPSGTVSAQLKKLVNNGLVVEIKPPHTKNKLYIIRERFFNIWYLMRNGRKGDKNRVIWLARFFENWLSPKELRKRVEKFIDSYEQDVYEEEQKAYLSLLYQHPILKTPRYLIDKILSHIQFPIIKQEERILNEQKDIYKYKLSNPNFNFSSKEFKDLLFSSMISLNTKSKIIEQFQSLSYEGFEKIQNALKKEKKYLRKKAVELSAVTDDCEGNYISLAKFHEEYLNNDEQGLYYYAKAAEIGCFNNYELGKQYLKSEDYHNAEKYLLISLQDDENADAYYDLAELYEDGFKDLSLARDYFKQSYKKTSNKNSLFGYALVSDKIGDYKEAEMAYLEHINKFDEKRAYNNLAIVYEYSNDFEKAIEFYQKAIEKGENQYAKINLANLYIDKIQNFEKGEKLLLEEVNKGNTNSMYYLAWNYYLLGKYPQKALDLSSSAYKNEKSIYIANTHATVLLWNNKYKEAKKVSSDFFGNIESYEKFSEGIIDYILLLISKGRFEDAFELFGEEMGSKFSLKDRFKPVYFALMHYMKETHPLEYLKMGEELKETVEEIIVKIEEKKKMYS